MSFPVLPYSPIIIDTTFSHLWHAATQCFSHHDDTHRKKLEKELGKLWTSQYNRNHVMPLLSVRTGFDLFLRVKNFPVGSEVIMSAINIPDMTAIVRSHGLQIIPLDISIDTLEPKLDFFNQLITPKTVAIVVAHLYGRWVNMQPFVDIAQKHGLVVIEDCAECFCGFEHLGHPLSDISLFSFGVIKFYTSLGGCIAKIRDLDVYQKMDAIHNEYKRQTSAMYLEKVLKYSALYPWLQWQGLSKTGRYVLNRLGVDYKALFVRWMRGFPDRMLEMIRSQPSTALLSSMWHRHQGFKPSEFQMQKLKGYYFLCNLPVGYEAVGHHVAINNFWLFPVLVENADTVVNILNVLGVDAYRGATQLNIIVPCQKEEKDTTTASWHYPHEAKYLIDHVIYLPVNKLVPFHDLDLMLRACSVALELSKQPEFRPLHSRSKLFKSKL